MQSVSSAVLAVSLQSLSVVLSAALQMVRNVRTESTSFYRYFMLLCP